MEGPFILREGSPGGERYLGEYTDAAEALRRRDWLRRGADSRRFIFDVLGRDTDPPETGEIDWCEGCGEAAVLKSQEIGSCCGDPVERSQAYGVRC